MPLPTKELEEAYAQVQAGTTDEDDDLVLYPRRKPLHIPSGTSTSDSRTTWWNPSCPRHPFSQDHSTISSDTDSSASASAGRFTSEMNTSLSGGFPSDNIAYWPTALAQRNFEYAASPIFEFHDSMFHDYKSSERLLQSEPQGQYAPPAFNSNVQLPGPVEHPQYPPGLLPTASQFPFADAPSYTSFKLNRTPPKSGHPLFPPGLGLSLPEHHSKSQTQTRSIHILTIANMVRRAHVYRVSVVAPCPEKGWNDVPRLERWIKENV